MAGLHEPGPQASWQGPGLSVSAEYDTWHDSGCGNEVIQPGDPVEVDELMGDDVGGIGVHIGARISELASKGQVLVSRTVVDLVAGSGLSFDDLGDYELKGIPTAWRVFAVTG